MNNAHTNPVLTPILVASGVININGSCKSSQSGHCQIDVYSIGGDERDNNVWILEYFYHFVSHDKDYG